jgi:hypothetical protein
MGNKRFEVGWRRDGRQHGWTCLPDPGEPSGVQGYHPLERWTPRRARRLRQWHGPRTQRQFSDLVEDRPFSRWWNQVAASEDDKLFLLRFPPGVWELPWELLVESLTATNHHRHVLIARGIDTPIPESPRIFDKPLNILILKGAQYADGYSRLDLEAEMAMIIDAWRGLPSGARECIRRPSITNADSAGLSDLLRRHQPDIVWFSGHGRQQPEPSLLFADGAWITSERFAESIKTSGHVPLYTVFWACDTGRGAPSHAGDVSSPAFFTALRRAGVLSSLLVLAPIADRSARKLAHTLFASLSASLSLETATARARADLLDDAEARTLDWALPVVWSSGLPEFRLEWDSVERARLQLLGGESLVRSLPSAQNLLGPPTPKERDLASAWVTRRRNWIAGGFNGEDKHVWLRTLQAIQVSTARVVICVDLSVDVGRLPDVETMLETWAERVYGHIRPGDSPGPLTTILYAMQRRPQKSWLDLCSLTDVFLAVVQPPAYEDTWFWQDLRSAAAVAVLSTDPVPQDIIGEWGQADRISQTLDDETIAAAFRQAPRLARALAVLGNPIAPTYLKLAGVIEGQPSTVRDWELAGTVLITTSSGGQVMAASARDYVLRPPVDQDALRQAHQDCAAILSDLRPTLQVSDDLLGHLVAAGLDGPALEQAAYLCERYWDERQPQAVRRTIRRLGTLWARLPMEVRLVAASANVAVGDMGLAKYWLDRAQPTAPLDVAWKHALMADVLKSEGTEASRQGALDSIGLAIESCTQAIASGDDRTRLLAQRRLREYRQDRARILQYLFYDASVAAAEYYALIDESRDDPAADLDVAVMKRNLAECLQVLATGPGDRRLDDARALLQEALKTASAHPQLPVRSEILYEQARMAEAQSAPAEAARLLGECIKAANEAGHDMMATIAENKRFWLSEPFSVEAWRGIADRLESFSEHGWAARSLMNTRIRAARVLEREGDRSGARSILQENRDLIILSQAFYIGRSDRRRIVLTYSGLAVLATDDVSASGYWREFLETYRWVREWLSSRAIHDSAQAWRDL